MVLGFDASSLWTSGAEQLVRLAAVVTATTLVWQHAVAPLVFRPIGKALARGARSEAEAAVHELVDPHIDALTEGQTQLGQRLDHLTDQLGEMIDRMPPTT